MKWNIQGADRDDGSEVTLVVVASSEADAVARANARGLVVSRVAPVAENAATKPQLVVTGGPDPGTADKRVPCPNCSEKVLPDATVCPYCKQAIFAKTKGANAVVGLIAFVVTFLILWYAISAFVNHESDKEFRRIMDQAERETDRLMRR